MWTCIGGTRRVVHVLGGHVPYTCMSCTQHAPAADHLTQPCPNLPPRLTTSPPSPPPLRPPSPLLPSLPPRPLLLLPQQRAAAAVRDLHAGVAAVGGARVLRPQQAVGGRHRGAQRHGLERRRQVRGRAGCVGCVLRRRAQACTGELVGGAQRHGLERRRQVRGRAGCVGCVLRRRAQACTGELVGGAQRHGLERRRQVRGRAGCVGCVLRRRAQACTGELVGGAQRHGLERRRQVRRWKELTGRGPTRCNPLHVGTVQCGTPGSLHVPKRRPDPACAPVPPYPFPTPSSSPPSLAAYSLSSGGSDWTTIQVGQRRAAHGVATWVRSSSLPTYHGPVLCTD